MNRRKLIFIISFFLIILLIVSLFGYKIILDKKTNKIVTTAIELEEPRQENQNEEEVTIVILNDKKETEENIERNEEQNIQEEKKEEPIDETQNNQQKNNSNQISETQNKKVEQQSSQETKKVDSFYIKVNYGANVVTVYTKDSNGNYTNPYKAFTCSTGTATPTSGTYNIDYKYRWLGLFGNVYGQYCTRIVSNILFHSVPYLEKENPATLEYWEYDKLRYCSFCWMYKTNSGRC